MSNFMQRLLTAAVLVPALLVSLYWDPTTWSILAFTVVAAGFAHDEYLRMALRATEEDAKRSIRAVGLLGGTAVIVFTMIYGPKALAPAATGVALTLAAAILFRKRSLPDAGHHFAGALSGLLYVPVMASVWPLLKHDFGTQGPSWLFLTLATAFFSDTMAYFFGRAFGKHKLYPEVSPGKTWEGAVGGLLGGVLALGVLGSLWLLPELPLVHGIILGLLGSAVGQIGDLVQSMIKRTYGVKDSGNILPGHGGLLDRVDALLFVAPVVYYYAVLAVF